MKRNRLDISLTAVGATTLLVLILILVSMFLFKSQDVRRAEIKIKGQQAAVSIASAIGHANEVGIPFESIVGLGALVGARQNANPDILAVAAETSNGATLYRSGQGTGPDTNPADQVVAPIMSKGQLVGKVTVWLNQPRLCQSSVSPVIALLILMLTACVFLREAATFALFRGVETRASAVLRMSLQIRVGDFGSVIIPAISHVGDAASSVLANRIRALNEKSLRLQRLVESLSNTEPDLTERQILTAINADAQAGACFAMGKPKQIRLSTVVSDSRWMLFLTAFVGEGIRAAVPAMDAIATFSPAYAVTLSALGALFGTFVALRLYGRQSPAGFVVVGLLSMFAGICTALILESEVTFLSARLACGFGLGLVVAGCAQAIDNRRSTAQSELSWLVAVVLGGEIAGPPVTALLAGMMGPTGGLAPLLAVTVFAIAFFIWIQASDSAWQERPHRLDLRLHDLGVFKRAHYPIFCQGIFWGICTGYLVTGDWVIHLRGLGGMTTWAVGWLALSLGCTAGMFCKDRWFKIVGLAGIIGSAILGVLPWVTSWDGLAFLGIFSLGLAGWGSLQRLWRMQSEHPARWNAILVLLGILSGASLIGVCSPVQSDLAMVAVWTIAAGCIAIAVWLSRPAKPSSLIEA